MWLLTTGPVVGIPMILAERPKERTAGVSSRSIILTSKVQFFDIFRGVVGLLDVLMVSNSAELKSFSLTICILAPESTTNSLSSGSFVDAAGSAHSSAVKQNVALSFSLNLYAFGKVPCLALGTSLLSFSLFLELVLKFQSVGTSLVKNFDIFLQRWSFLVLDTRVT